VSITSHDGLVAVLNSGGAGSVSEYRLQQDRLIALNNETDHWMANTTPPNFLPRWSGRLQPERQFLIATTKVRQFLRGLLGRIRGNLSSSAKVSGAANAVPFSFTFDAQGRIVATEASNSSVSTYSLVRMGH